MNNNIIKILLAFAALAILNVAAVASENIRIEGIDVENAYIFNVSTYNSNDYGIKAEALVTFWPGDSAGEGVNAEDVFIRPGNSSISVYAPKLLSDDRNASKYEVRLLDANRKEIASEDITPQERPENLEYGVFLLVSLIALAIGYLIGSDRGYKKGFSDSKTEEVLRNREKQK